MYRPMPTQTDETLELVLKGKLLSKVEIAEAFREPGRALGILARFVTERSL